LDLNSQEDSKQKISWTSFTDDAPTETLDSSQSTSTKKQHNPRQRSSKDNTAFTFESSDAEPLQPKIQKTTVLANRTDDVDGNTLTCVRRTSSLISNRLEMKKDIPVIPDLEEVQEEEIQLAIAAPPTVNETHLQSLGELENDLNDQLGFTPQVILSFIYRKTFLTDIL
jgi:hypothetical protein